MRRWIVALAVLGLPAAAWAGAKASAFQKESRMGANTWAAASAIDGRLETAWMVPGESDNKGEWIEIDLPRGDVDAITVFPGYGKSDETFTDYPRLKKLRVDVFALDDQQNAKQVGTATLDVADKREVQTFDLPDAKIGEGLFGGKIKITVLEIYDGEDFPNLALSEVMVTMKEFDAQGVQVTEISGEDLGHERAMALDANAKTFWSTAGTTVEMTLTSNGYGLSSIGFQAASKDYSRPKTVEVTCQGLTTTTVLPDSLTAPQYAAVPGFNGYTGGAFGDVKVKIVDVYPGPKNAIGVSEIKPRATNYEAI